ncbi:rod shape-determining protein MreC [Pseudorhodoferax sp.]|uniref:rod shape-determining protein MreC n=1 Tax=Pseudorhodoferax sp. TaxID=1993553 RepID=UPI002DD634EB|nr:rod shape-determining protein MreC [Pseudorhodoferax sp.]
MPLGTLDRTPPPFFRQGPSALTKLVFFSALALFLMVADGRFRIVQPLRAGLAVLLLPVQRTLAVPVQMWQGGADYLGGLDQALKASRDAEARLATQGELTGRLNRLTAENEQLRGLLGLQPALPTRTLAAEVLYEAADPFSRKLVINRGQTHGVALAAPVAGEAGVLGQVTRLYPLTSEVMLLIDKDAAIPVLNRRTGQRSVAFGGVYLPDGGGMELRFMSGNADVQAGDELVTSGLDGVYPPGLAVARVLTVERRVGESGFARILLQPAAEPDAVRHVLVLAPVGRTQPVAATTAASAPMAAKAASASAASAARAAR